MKYMNINKTYWFNCLDWGWVSVVRDKSLWQIFRYYFSSWTRRWVKIGFSLENDSEKFLLNYCIFSEWCNSINGYNVKRLQECVSSRPEGTPLLTVSNHYSCIDDPALWGKMLVLYFENCIFFLYPSCSDSKVACTKQSLKIVVLMYHLYRIIFWKLFLCGNRYYLYSEELVTVSRYVSFCFLFLSFSFLIQYITISSIFGIKSFFRFLCLNWYHTSFIYKF